MIFLINALGLWASGGSTWGVWILEVIGIFASVWMAFSVLKKPFGELAAALGVLSGLTLLLITLHGGNYTEEYAIPFQLAGLFFLVQSEQKGGFWPAFACGIALGILFFIQQTLISVGIAIGLYLVLRSILDRSWKPFKQIAWIALGAIGISGIFLGWMAIQGILPGFWDGAFVYGMVYSNLGLLEHLKALGDTMQFFESIPLLLIALPVWLLALFLLLRDGTGTIIKILKNQWIGWGLLAIGLFALAAGIGANLLRGSQHGMGLLQQTAIILGAILTGLGILQLFKLLPRLIVPWLERINYHLPPASTTILAVAVLWYPIEVIMTNLSGRSYLHYYMAMCAVCIVLYAFLADQIKKLLVSWKIGGVNILITLAWCIGIALTLIYNPINTMRAFFTPGGNNSVQLEAARYIDANTQPADKVLVWGAEPVVNFFSNRSSPFRYTYVYTFYTKGYGGKAISAELLADLQTRKPVLIIYTGDTPFVNITADHNCVMPKKGLLPGMDDVMKSICSNYYYVGNVGSTAWKIYHINE
ncbi:MAG: glycosyltransferase family 39 protein [Anaerolineales bacterium]